MHRQVQGATDPEASEIDDAGLQCGVVLLLLKEDDTVILLNS